MQRTKIIFDLKVNNILITFHSNEEMFTLNY
jgi:hypothetical protein